MASKTNNDRCKKRHQRMQKDPAYRAVRIEAVRRWREKNRKKYNEYQRRYQRAYYHSKIK